MGSVSGRPFTIWKVDTELVETPVAITRETRAIFLLRAVTSVSAAPNPRWQGSDAPTTEAIVFECRLDGEEWLPCRSPKVYEGLSDGEHPVRATAVVDWDDSPAEYRWVVDTVPPTTTLLAAPPDPSSTPEATFRFEASETPVTFFCRLDGGAWRTCGSPKRYTGLASGTHLFAVYAVDQAGNEPPAPVTYAWAVYDGTPPQTTILAVPAGATSANPVTFTFAADEAGVIFECRFGAGPWQECISPVSYTVTRLGPQRCAVRAIDPSGNVDPSPAEVTWTALPPVAWRQPNLGTLGGEWSPITTVPPAPTPRSSVPSPQPI